MAKDDWYRQPCLTEVAKGEFEERLKRSRSSKPEYMRIQADALAVAKRYHDAVVMLDRILTDYPDHLAAWLYESRAECHRQLHQPDEAILDYRASIATMRKHPGVKGNAPIRLASLVFEKARTELYEECLGHITDFWDANPIFPRYELHQFGWTAILLHAMGEHDGAKPPARRALAAAAKTRSNAAKHRMLGLVIDADRPMLRRLRKIVGGAPFVSPARDARKLLAKLRNFIQP